LRAGAVEEFLAPLAEHDVAMSARILQARERSEVLRYVGLIDPAGK